MKCAKCGTDYQGNFCPNCGNPAPGNAEAPAKKGKKAFYKRWWFWVLLIFVCFLAIPTSSKDKPQQTPSEPSTQTAQKAPAVTEPATESDNDLDQPSKTETNDKNSAPVWTETQKNVMSKAKSYLAYSGFSYTGLIEQLEYEKFAHEDAVWAADNCNADWNEEALESAKSYIDYSGFSYTGLIDQLEYGGFTTEEATYGADNCGADWNAEAAESAKAYLKYSSFSRDGLIDQLEYEGFTHEQAVYGVDQTGL